MKETRILFLVFMVSCLLFSMTMYGCNGGGDGPASPSFTPTGGKWAGDNIQFFVSSDGSKITTSGSSLKGGVSLILGPIPFSGACSGTRTSSLVADIPINNLSFELKWTGLEIKGQFSSATSASGTYSYSDYDPVCGGTVSGSGNWSASPK